MSPTKDIATLAEKIKDIKVAMFTTIEKETGLLHSRPMSTQQFEFDGQLWFFTKEHSPKVDSIQRDQHVNVSYSDYDSKKWVSVAGRASIVRDRQKMQELSTPMLKVWFEKGIDDPELALIRVDVESAQYWDSPSGPIVTLLGFAKQMITGQSLNKEEFSHKVDLHH